MVSSAGPTIAETIDAIPEPSSHVTVRLSNEIIGLLSEQLYQSPLKAIEELVVNAYDAGASECRISVPKAQNVPGAFIAVLDNGHGVNEQGMIDLWTVGRSKKRIDSEAEAGARKPIGKFGIGKLATRAIARRVTYISRASERLLGVSLNYQAFTEDASGVGDPVELGIKEISEEGLLLSDVNFQLACESLGVEAKRLISGGVETWTMSILEDLKSSKPIHLGRLRWVLSTAMPLRDDFILYLNTEPVESSKASHEPLVEFNIVELSPARLEALQTGTEDPWRVEGNALVCNALPTGVTGTVIVMAEPLDRGKSSEIGRSFGFFIRVRNRLINEDDPLFGLKPLSFTTFYRMQAVIDADDLDADITAPREGVVGSDRTSKFQLLLRELFNEARERYDAKEGERAEVENRKKEHERDYLSPRLVEHPVADVLSEYGAEAGSEADRSWFYLEVRKETNIQNLIQALYNNPRAAYRYQYRSSGRSNRLVAFDPENSTFLINEDHDLVGHYVDEPQAKILLEDLVTAEVLLEVYLREARIPAETVGQVLERRDLLLRSLAKDHMFSLAAIARFLEDSSSHEHDLEVGLVAAARGLGFVATHVGRAGQPDGLAEFVDYSSGQKTITLEAKSSQSVPSLSQIDFGGLAEHVRRYDANGCLLVAPAYPAPTDEDSAAAARADMQKISCWTIADLARVVRSAEARHFNAETVLNIVLTKFKPTDVEQAVENLFRTPEWDMQTLYRAVIAALYRLDGKLPGTLRTVEHIQAHISEMPNLRGIGGTAIVQAVHEMAAASTGIMTVRDNKIHLFGSLPEIERRLSPLLKTQGKPRRLGRFRDDFAS
jgi:hypothetical protein